MNLKPVFKYLFYILAVVGFINLSFRPAAQALKKAGHTTISKSEKEKQDGTSTGFVSDAFEETPETDDCYDWDCCFFEHHTHFEKYCPLNGKLSAPTTLSYLGHPPLFILNSILII